LLSLSTVAPVSDPRTDSRIAYLERLTAQLVERVNELERPTEPAPRSEAMTMPESDE
jgi:hypothetical protein